MLEHLNQSIIHLSFVINYLDRSNLRYNSPQSGEIGSVIKRTYVTFKSWNIKVTNADMVALSITLWLYFSVQLRVGPSYGQNPLSFISVFVYIVISSFRVNCLNFSIRYQTWFLSEFILQSHFAHCSFRDTGLCANIPSHGLSSGFCLLYNGHPIMLLCHSSNKPI